MESSNPNPATEVPWSTGFCDCLSDVSSCCLTYWCPCITFGRIAEIVDSGSTSCCAIGTAYVLIAVLFGCPGLLSCSYRTKMRKQCMLKGDACTDCMAHCFCELCALSQQYRELKNRGFDMSIGWHANMERQNREVAMGAPKVEGGMSLQS